MIHARPNLNGNTKADFIEAAQKMCDAIYEMDRGITSIRVNVFHGRNYQHLPNAIDAHQADRDMLKDLVDLKQKANDLVRDILLAVEAGTRNWDEEANRASFEG